MEDFRTIIIFFGKSSVTNIDKFKTVLSTEKFKDLLKSLALSNFQIDYKILSLLKKNFWDIM